jgi:hypothetical protein
MANLLSLSVVSRNGKAVNDTWLIDSADIAGPSVEDFSTGGTFLRVNELASRSAIENTNQALAEYLVVEDPATISPMSHNLFDATVAKRGFTTLDTPTIYLFNIENLEGPIMPLQGGGSKFYYKDQGQVNPVYYEVQESPAVILANSIVHP